MSRKIEMVGGRYGRLTVIEEAGRIRKEALWRCKCDCGNEVCVSGYYLRSGHTKSCGCLIPERTKEANITHGLYGTRIHRIYTNMKTRCYNPNYYLFNRYGGHGITICDEWLRANGLANFHKWSIENGYSEKLSIDRIDNKKGYSPDNCRWVTMSDQQNNRTNNRVFIVNGKAKTMAKWAEELGVSYCTLQRHAKSGDAERYIMEKLYASA